MSKIAVANISDCYRAELPTKHQTGDIWRNIPSPFRLPCQNKIAVNITPACDLENDKTDTIIFLPIIPIKFFFFLPKMQKNILGKVQRFFKEKSILFPIDRIIPCVAIISKIQELSKRLKEQSDINKINSFISYFEIINKRVYPDNLNILCEIFSAKELKEEKVKIINNQYGTTYFLPKEKMFYEEFGVLQEHSVVLLQYPFALPIDFLYPVFSMDTDWNQHCQNANFIFGNEFSKNRPICSLQIKQYILDDLLSHYSTRHMRIGAPEYSQAALDVIIDVIR